jgi:isoleucyl-tRNA synthetase
MPYASNHFPFENSDSFHNSRFPADFIAEGLDQTRGWFYTLTVLGNKLFNTSPFRNVIVNGIVLAENGTKMSKSLKNYPDPNGILDTYGSDSLRLYLINSPVVRAEPMRFQESGVKDIVSRVLLPLWNSYRFFHEQTLLYKQSTGQDFVQASIGDQAPSNVMDRWILADCQSLIRFMDQEMQGMAGTPVLGFEKPIADLVDLPGYRLYTVVPRLLQVIDNLTNWYIRFNRKRLKGVAGLGAQDTTAALNTLLQVLFTIVRALAPFTPFITEHIYQLLKPRLIDAITQFQDPRSVHFLPFPTVQEALFDEVIERQVSTMQKVIQLGRVARERRSLSLKTPLLSLVVIADSQLLSDIEPLKTYIQEELNIRDIVLTTDSEQYNILLEARVDWPSLGKKLKKDVQTVLKSLPSITQAQLRKYQRDLKLTINWIELTVYDLTLVRVIGQAKPNTSTSTNTDNNDGDGPQYEPAFAPDMIILLDTAPHPELVDEGLARELVNRIQRLRKKADLAPTDEIYMRYCVVSDPDGVGIREVVASKQDMFMALLRGRLEEEVQGSSEDRESLILEEEQTVGNLVLRLQLARI